MRGFHFLLVIGTLVNLHFAVGNFVIVTGVTWTGFCQYYIRFIIIIRIEHVSEVILRLHGRPPAHILDSLHLLTGFFKGSVPLFQLVWVSVPLEAQQIQHFRFTPLFLGALPRLVDGLVFFLIKHYRLRVNSLVQVHT